MVLLFLKAPADLAPSRNLGAAFQYADNCIEVPRSVLGRLTALGTANVVGIEFARRG
jgi:hypothetical protein